MTNRRRADQWTAFVPYRIFDVLENLIVTVPRWFVYAVQSAELLNGIIGQPSETVGHAAPFSNVTRIFSRSFSRLRLTRRTWTHN